MQAAGTTPLFTLHGVKSTGGITIGEDGTVTLPEAVLNGENVILAGDGYTLALADGVTAPSDKTAGFTDIVDGTTSYMSAGKSAGYVLGTVASDDDEPQDDDAPSKYITYMSDTSVALFTLSGIKAIDDNCLDDKTITLTTAQLDGKNVMLDGKGYKLALASGIDAPEYSDAQFTAIVDGSSTYKSDGNTAGYELAADGSGISYASETAASELFTLSGIRSTEDIGVSGTTVTLAAKNLTDNDVTISGGNYTLALSGVDNPINYDAPHFTDVISSAATYRSAGNSGSYTLSEDSSTAIYTATTQSDLFTPVGITSTTGITVGDTTITLTANNINQGTDISLDGEGYTLALASDITIAQHYPAGFTDVVDGATTYQSAGNTAGYEITADGKDITYLNAVAATDIFTLNGVGSKDGITVSGTTVTLTASNLNNANVTISDGDYILALASGVTAPSETGVHFTDVVDGASTYKSAGNTAGYALASGSKSINYTAAVAETDLFTLNGLSTTTGGITVSGTTVTLTAGNLNNRDVTISDGDYTLALASGIAAPVTSAAHFDGLTYKSAGVTSAGYSVINEGKRIEYNSAFAAIDLFTLTGVSSTDGITIDGNTVILSAANLDGSAVSIEGEGYTLALADGISVPEATAAHFDGLTYKSASSTAGYALSEDGKSIAYTAELAATDLFTLSGINSTNDITIEGSTVTLAASSLNGESVSITGDYTLALASGISAPEATAAHFTRRGDVSIGRNFGRLYTLGGRQVDRIHGGGRRNRSVYAQRHQLDGRHYDRRLDSDIGGIESQWRERIDHRRL